jgi:ubiquinone/menaquinone biosynthesis C-methylase UbiE
MHKFDPENASRLEQAERYELLPPEETLRRVGLRPGMQFLDVGAGTGFFSRAAATIVGADGRVIALEMSLRMIDVLRSNGVTANMEVLLCDEYSLPLPDASIDLALLAFVLHENGEPRRLLEEVFRTLKRGGRLVIIEWKKQVEENGPPAGERLAEEEVRTLIGGWTSEGIIHLNGSHYGVVIRKD